VIDQENKLNNKYECVKEIKNAGRPCDKSDCRHYFKCISHSNCSIIAAQNGPMTLQEIGDNFELSRMRICQIEKSLLKKIREENKLLEEF